MSREILYIGNVLSKHGYSVTTIETLGPQLENLGYKIFYSSNKLKMYSRLFNMVWSVFKYRNRVSKVLIDTYSNNAFWYAYLVAYACKFLKLPYFPILHGGKLPIWIEDHKKASNKIFKNSSINISPSQYNKHAFEKKGYATIFIPNNIKIEDYKFTERKQCQPLLLYVRSFDSIYNPEMAIKVLAKVREQYPQAELCMVGPDKDGSLKVCEELAESLNVKDGLRITGMLKKQDWHKLSENYSIFINTTNIDNMPVSVIEAMALGLPVVSTNAGGLPFLVNNGVDGILVEIGNTNEMVDAVLSLIKNAKLSNQLSVNARLKSEGFDWGAVKNKWIEVLK